MMPLKNNNTRILSTAHPNPQPKSCQKNRTLLYIYKPFIWNANKIKAMARPASLTKN